jgi:hypothetical protein
MKHIKPPKSPCSHRVYQLDCAEYDRLLAHADGRCQICGVAPEGTKHGHLVVDHDASVGQWAVRGLLCSNCNTALPIGTAPEWAADYLARPWWKLELERRGVEVSPLPEPPRGSVVMACRGIRWRRTGDRWEHVANYGGLPRSWSQLQRRYGPHNIRVLSAGPVRPDEEPTA